MSKRMTETGKWETPWFRKMSSKHKLLWGWLCDRCDSSGVIDVDWELASFQIGEKVSESDLKAFDQRVSKLPSGKLYLTSFVSFQYGKLSEASRPHAAVISLLRRHGIEIGSEGLPLFTPQIGLAKGIDTLQEQDKDQDKDKTRLRKDRASLEELREFCASVGLPESDGEASFHKWEGNGWKNGTSTIKDWKATIRSWQASGYMPSQKGAQNGHSVTLPPPRGC